MEYTQEENLLIQSYFTTSFLLELKNLNFLDSEYYKNAEFQDKYVQENLPFIGIDNQGTILMVLYTMLVIPKQLIESDFPEDFNNLNRVIDDLKSSAHSTYRRDSGQIDYIRHIRNSVAHARITFVPNTEVIFSDENNRGENCSITIPLQKFGLFLTGLQRVFFKFIDRLKHNQ